MVGVAMNVQTAVIPWESAYAGPRELLSLREVTTLAEVPETRVRKDIETGLLKLYVVRLRDARLCFHWTHVLTVAAVYGNTSMPGSLRKIALGKMSNLPRCSLQMAEWVAAPRRDYDCHEALRIPLDKFLTLDLDEACKKVKPRLHLYVSGLSRTEERPDVLGGEAIFKDSRLPVMHVGKMIDRGETMANILEDYPYLTESDVHFARLYYRAHPLVGRPRTSGESGNVAELATG